MSQFLPIALVNAPSHSVPPAFERLCGQEFAEEGDLSDYHEINAILDVLGLGNEVRGRVALGAELDETVLREDEVAGLDAIRVLRLLQDRCLLRGGSGRSGVGLKRNEHLLLALLDLPEEVGNLLSRAWLGLFSRQSVLETRLSVGDSPCDLAAGLVNTSDLSPGRRSDMGGCHA